MTDSRAADGDEGTHVEPGEPAIGEADEAVTRAARAAAELRERYDERHAIEDRIEEIGRERVEAAADGYRTAIRVLDRYEEDATGTGDFESYVRFESEFDAATNVDEDVPAGDAFEAADEAADKRRLSTEDFEAAREALEPAGEYVDLLERRDEAIDAYRRARHDAREARDELAEHVSDLERIEEHADVDLDAAVEELEEPIEAYNEAVEADFETLLKAESAREVFDVLETAERYPLVEVDRPPADLREYVAEHAAGEEPLRTLLEYADYSPSKLDHYVEDPGALRTAVAVHRTWIDRLDCEPFRVEWPPKPAEELRYRIKELTPIVSRFADEETVALLRAVDDLTRSEEYESLREAATVRAELDDEELSLLVSGVIHDRLTTARDVLGLLESVIAETEE
jgi:exonuclease VII small subunit